VSVALVAELSQALSCPVESDVDVLASFTRDYAPLAPSGLPLVMVRAKTREDIQKTLQFANARRIPVVTRAAGTGLAGGCNAIDGCIVLLVSALNRIIHIDAQAGTAVVEPGVLNIALANAAKEVGLYYPPDPSSREISTIGGNIATNAGGACCLKYGVTGDHVAALKVLLADGTLIRTGALSRKNVAGLDLNRLMIGSEGTLGVIVEATVRLSRPPRPASTLVAYFDSMQSAAAAIGAMESTSELSLIELMDRTTIRAVEEMTSMELDLAAAAMVLVQSDAVDGARVIETCSQRCQREGSRSVMLTHDETEGQMLLKARHLALPALERMGTTLLDDVGVPKNQLPALFASIESIASKHGLTIGTFGHAGDGNMHPTIVFHRDSEAETASAQAAFADIIESAMALGGTISGEHGIGSLKTPFLTAMIGVSERALMQRIKAAFDPFGILNPGKGL
jgi:glycolate oxidase